MMDLKDKYSQLIRYAGRPLVENLSVTEENNVLYISGKTTQYVKDKLWNLYNQIDPDMRSGDLVMDIKVDDSEDYPEMYEVKTGDSLSKIAQKYPNMSWQKIMEANKDTIQDPNKIFPGQKIKIPL